MSKVTSTIDIPQPNIFGRIGTGIGQGLAEQLPKEIERGRLASHLQNLGQQQNLTPFQQLAGILSAPGITPQGIQSAENLLRRQGIAQGFGKPTQGFSQQGYPSSVNPRENIEPGSNVNINIPQNIPQAAGSKGYPSQEIVSPNESGQSQIVPKNPLSSELQPKARWNPERYADEIARLAERHPHLSYPELRELAQENEHRELSRPEDFRNQQNALRETQDRLRDKFRNSLELKLQKEGKDVFSDISGPMQNNLIRGMERDLVEHPNKSEDDVANEWSEKALNLSKSKKQLTSRGQSLNPLVVLADKSRINREIDADAEAYRKSGNAEELYHDLQSNYGLSPIGAAYKSYPRSKNVKSYLKNYDIDTKRLLPHTPESLAKRARKVATDLEKIITPQDSILAIAKALQYKDPGFDRGSFFQQFLDDADEIGLTPEQKRQLGQSGQWVGNWADFLILPFSKGVD